MNVRKSLPDWHVTENIQKNPKDIKNKKKKGKPSNNKQYNYIMGYVTELKCLKKKKYNWIINILKFPQHPYPSSKAT